jgi:hypothetical protein
VNFVRRRDAAECVICWAKPTKIYRAKERFVDGLSSINWSVGVTAQSYKPSMDDKDWAKAWEERNRIERGETPKEVLAPRWMQASVRREECRQMQKQHPHDFSSKYPSTGRSERQPKKNRDSGSAGIQNCQSDPLIADTGIVGGTSMETDTVFTAATLVDSPASCSRDGITTIDVDDFLEKIVEDSDLAALSLAKAALHRAAQNLMDTVDEIDALIYEPHASAEAGESGIPYSGSSRTRKTSIEGATGEQDSIGPVQALFCIQRMVELGLRI